MATKQQQIDWLKAEVEEWKSAYEALKSLKVGRMADLAALLPPEGMATREQLFAENVRLREAMSWLMESMSVTSATKARLMTYLRPIEQAPAI